MCTIPMNKIFKTLLFTISCILMFNTAPAQNVKSPLEEIVYLFRNNKIEDVTRYFDNFVPVSINNNASNYSRNQAGLVVKDFFDKNPVRDFNVMDSGTPSPTSRSMIATFSSNSVRYTLYLLVKQKDNNNYVIKEIKISKQ